MPTSNIDPLYPHWFRCDPCGKDVAEVLAAESFDLVSLTARQVIKLCPEASGEIDAHEHGYPMAAQTKGRTGFDPD
jgi:hypothetical protein